MLGRTATLNIYATAEMEQIFNEQLRIFCDRISYDVVFHPIDTTRQAIIYEDHSLTVSTIPLQHRVPCCGFLFAEKPTLPHIRKEKMDFYNIPSSQIGNIKAGADWITEDGQIVPNSHLVMPAEQPRSYAYCSDTRYMSDLKQYISDVNMLYHESTYGDDNILLAKKYYHSTARQAAQAACDVNAKQLILGHYSSRYEDENILLEEAKAIFGNTFLAQENTVFEV